MIELVLTGNRWTWTMISDAGRVLAYADASWPTDLEAAEAARRFRAGLWAVADSVDHRQARAI